MTTVQSRKRNDLKGFIRKSIYKHCQELKVQLLILLLSHQYQHHHHKVGPQKRFFHFPLCLLTICEVMLMNQKFHPKLLCNTDSVNFQYLPLWKKRMQNAAPVWSKSFWKCKENVLFFAQNICNMFSDIYSF